MNTVVKLIALMLLIPIWGHAQEFPSNPVRVIVPFAPGASTDMLARTVAQKMQQNMGASFVVENQAGASGMLGINAVAKAAPNGYTLGIASPSTHSIAAALKKKLPYDPIKDFTLISTLAKYISVLVVNPQLPASTLKEFIDYAKRNPSKVSYASAGAGSSTHLLAEMLQLTGQFKMVHVPFRGGGQGLQDLMGGHVPAAVISIAGVGNLIKEGKLRAIAVFERERYAEFPNVPAVTEELRDIRPRISWFGLLGPAGLPPTVTSKLNAEVLKALKAPDVRQKLEPMAFLMLGSSSQEFAEVIREDITAWSKIVATADIKVDD